MPKLPTDAELGTVPADASGRIASVSNAGAAGEAAAQLGANVVQFGSTILDVHDENAQAAADSAVWRGKVALDQKYRNDPDPATAPQRYNDELTNLVSQSAGGIIQPRIKTQFMDMANRYVVARGVEMIQNQSDTALTNQAVAKLSDDGDAGVTAFAHSTDPRDQFGITQAYYGQVDAMVKARTLDATVGEKLKKDFIHRAIYSNIANAGTPEEMIKRWNGFNGVETPEPAAAATPGATTTAPATGGQDTYKAALLKGESGGALVPPKTPGGPAGKYQIDAATAKSWGINYADLTDPSPAAQARVDAGFERGKQINSDILKESLGREPTDAELTLAHQQGPGGAVMLLDPAMKDRSALSVLTAANNGNELKARQSITGNGGSLDMTAGQFADHVMGYYGASGAPGASTGAANENTPAEPTMASEPAPGSMASKVPSDVYDTMAAGIQTELNRAQAQIDHKQAVDEKLRKQATDTAITGYQQQMIMHAADPTQPDIDMVKASQDPRLKGDPTALPSLIAFQKSLDHPVKDDSLDKATTQEIYRGLIDGTKTVKDAQDAFAPPDGSPAKISQGNLNFLTGVAKNGEGTEGKNFNAMKDAFLKSETDQITHVMGIKIGGDEDVYRFTFDLEKAIAAKQKAGQDPNVLLDPTSKDYFGAPGNMKNYVKPLSERLAQAAAAANAASGTVATPGAIPPDLPAGTVSAGKTKDGRDAYKLPDGTMVAVGVPVSAVAPAAPVPVTAPAPVMGPPTVPSGP